MSTHLLIDDEDDHDTILPSTSQTVTTAKEMASQPSSKSNSLPTCRICLQRSPTGKLVAPCRCTGSVSWIHMSCLERWLTESQSSQCEICRTTFVTFSRYLGFGSWLGSCPRQLVSDVVLSMFLGPLAILSIFLCYRGATTEYRNDNKTQSFSLFFIGFLLTCVSILWTLTAIRNHYVAYYTYRMTNPIRTVDLTATMDRILDEDSRRKSSSVTQQTTIDVPEL